MRHVMFVLMLTSSADVFIHVEARIAADQFRHVYLDLHGSPSLEGPFFVVDADADGLLASPPDDGDVQVVYEGNSPPLLLNGDHGRHWRNANASSTAMAVAESNDSHALGVVLTALETRSGSR